MHKLNKRNNRGFSAIEAVLVVATIAIVVLGRSLCRQEKPVTRPDSATKTSTTSAPARQPAKPRVLPVAFFTATKQDAASETKTDNSYDSKVQDNSTSANSAASDVGDAYNEDSL
jgi:hypothetical protein